METGVYIHIPFCKSKCFYCDFLSFTQKNYAQYTKKLLWEIQNSSQLKNSVVKTIFIGGGTPSLFSCMLIYKILSQINFSDADEITIEVNPESIEQKKIDAYKSFGINRISIGLEAIQNNLLKDIGRIHTFEKFERAYEIIDKRFENINIDLMFGLPNQKIGDWLETLAYVKKIKPAHISVYSLIIEPHTKFYDMELKSPDENTERQMYHLAKEKLMSDYAQYEISNFAREKKYECQHNKIYWTLGNYLGFGLGAHSFFNNIRWNNICNMEKYLKAESLHENIIHSTQKSLMEEFMFLGLRMNCGVDKNIFHEKFGSHIKNIYQSQINSLIRKKLLVEDKNSLRLTNLGMDLANYVMSEFIFD